VTVYARYLSEFFQRHHPDFYCASVSPHLEEAVGHLNVTAWGWQWIANLHSHVFCAEHSFALMRTQR
jgi:hypothetical protein